MLATPGAQRSSLTPGGNFGAGATPGGSPGAVPGANMMAPGSFSKPGTSSYLAPSSSIQQQQPSLGGGGTGGTGMAPSMSQYADSSNISNLLRALVGNKDRI